MSATQFGLTILYVAVAVFFYAAGWWQGKTVERDRWEERVARKMKSLTRSTGAAGSTGSRAGGARTSPTYSSAVVDPSRHSRTAAFFALS